MPETQAVSKSTETIWSESAAALYAGDVARFLEYWHPEACYEVAYPIEGMPRKLEGREALTATFEALLSLARTIRVDDIRFHQTTDPKVAFVQERMILELRDGTVYENDLCMRVDFQEELIASVYEYYGERAHERLISSLSAR